MFKVLIADDSASTRLALENIISKEPGFKVVGMAFDGEEVLRKIEYLKPDLITLDIEMPKLNGLQVLDKIMKYNPIPVIVVSSLTPVNSRETLLALEAGAVDCILKPSSYPYKSNTNFENELIDKLKAALNARFFNWDRTDPDLSDQPQKTTNSNFDIVVLGISTGGPSSLKKVIPYFPEYLPVSFIIAQHMPMGLSQSFVENLNAMSNIRVKEAEDGDIVTPGRILVAPSGYQTTFKQRQNGVTVKISNPSRDDLYKPSIDLLFSSAAKIFKSRVLGVIMTGMGNDGTKGSNDIKMSGGMIIAESPETCVIYGMPKSVIDAGLVDHIVPLNRIVDKVMDLI